MAEANTQSLEAALRTTHCDMLLLDNAETPTQIAFFHHDTVLEVWHKPADSLIGKIMWARVLQVFPQHQRAALRLPEGQEASLRVPASVKLTAGQMIIVTITADAYADKPAAAVLGAEIAGALVILKLAGSGIIRSSHKQSSKTDETSAGLSADDVPACQAMLPAHTDIILRRRAAAADSADILQEIALLAASAIAASKHMQNKSAEPKLIEAGPSAVIQARLRAPHAVINTDSKHGHWQILGEQAERACSAAVYSPSGVCLWFHQSRALMAVDVDSAKSKLGPEALVAEACCLLMQQIRLRQLAGIIIFDLPRLSKAGRAGALTWLEALAAEDLRHPDILGFGPAGMIELRIRHGRAPEADVKGASEII